MEMTASSTKWSCECDVHLSSSVSASMAAPSSSSSTKWGCECDVHLSSAVSASMAVPSSSSSTKWGCECDVHLSSSVSASMAAPSSSSSSSFRGSYDVFLSFRGEDTRFSFAAHFYDALERRGVNAFFDDRKIRRGESISPTIKKLAIEGSRSSIVILSQNYANSTWCLEELVKMLDCWKTMGQLVLPIFFSVDPSDVRKHEGSFGEALVKHEKALNRNVDKVKKWREALTEVANLAG